VPTKRIIPGLLLRGGRLVKGVRFDDHRDAGNPKTTARAYNAQGADEIMLLDIDASREGRPPALDVIADVAKECFVPLTVGGGISDVGIANDCMAVGADRVCLTTTALDCPALITEIAERFGSQAVVVSIDVVHGDAEAHIIDHRTGTAVDGHPFQEWVAEVIARGAGEVRVMSHDREGSRAGQPPGFVEQVGALVSTPFCVEGGLGSFRQIADTLEAGASGVGLGTMLVFEDNNIIKVKSALKELGQQVRL
jgi:cyclase